MASPPDKKTEKIGSATAVPDLDAVLKAAEAAQKGYALDGRLVVAKELECQSPATITPSKKIRSVSILPPPLPPRVAGSGAGASGGSASLNGQYILMPNRGTYALGVEALRESYQKGECSQQPTITIARNTIVRPLTFKEDITARVVDFNCLKNPDGSDRTFEDRLRFFDKWLDSCTGIGYQAGSTKFKIVPVCEPLITIAKDVRTAYLDTPYSSLGGVELDSTNGKYGSLLTPTEIEHHEGWRAALEGDVHLLKQCRDIVFTALQERNVNKKRPERTMAFHVRTGYTTDELRALCVNYLGSSSDAYGDDDLGISGSFLRVAHR